MQLSNCLVEVYCTACLNLNEVDDDGNNITYSYVHAWLQVCCSTTGRCTQAPSCDVPFVVFPQRSPLQQCDKLSTFHAGMGFTPTRIRISTIAPT